MALVTIAGSDPAVLEGAAQALAAAGHQVRTAAEAGDLARAPAPLVALLDRAAAGALSTVALAPGGAVVLYRTGDTPPGPATLTPALRRATVAELVLPLERHRLVALVRQLAERAQRAGRGDDAPEPPEHRAV